MSTSAITRQLDSLGRVVIPVEMRRRLNIENKDYVEIFCENDRIILKKSAETCVFCGCEDSILRFKDKCICTDCLSQLKK